MSTAPPDAIWLAEDALLEVPQGAGPWGFVAAGPDGQPRFESVADAGELGLRVRDGTAPPPALVWGPGDRNLRTAYELPAIADDVVNQGLQENARRMRHSLPRAGLAVVGIAASAALWPEDVETRMLFLLAAIVLIPIVWQQGVEAAWVAWWERRLIERDPTTWRHRQARRTRFLLFARITVSATALGLVGTFALIWLVTRWTGDERAVLALALIKDPEHFAVPRLLSYAFLHLGFLHLFLNSMAGYSLASLVRVAVSELDILLVFLAGALLGGAASYAFLPTVTTVGASGGVLAWGGLALGVSLRREELRGIGLVSGMIRWVLLIGMIGFAGADFIDNAAHAGGLVAGLAAGLWIGGRRTRTARARGRGSAERLLVPALGGLLVWLLVRLLGRG